MVVKIFCLYQIICGEDGWFNFMDVLFVSIPDYKIRNDGEINYDSFIAWKGNEYISSNFNSDEISIIERIGEELKYVI